MRVIEYAISDYVRNGKTNPSDYLNYIGEFTKGGNRAKKALGHLLALVNKNAHLLKILSSKTNGDFESLPPKDRKVIIICLFALTFPITYDMLQAFSVGFKVQDIISKRVIREKMGAIYGSNRSMHIGVDETMPLIIDGGIVERVKTGFFRKTPKLKISGQLAAEIVIYTDITLSASKTLLIEDLGYKPWFLFFDISTFADSKLNIILTTKESSLGKGYLSVK